MDTAGTMTTRKTEGWQARLTAYLAASSTTPFRPGRLDCATFAAGAVEAMTGVDLAADWRGKYRTLEAGRARLAKAGYADQVALVASLLPEVHPAMAHAGDVAVVDEDGAPALGIVQGEMIYVVTPQGFGLVPRSRMVRAFSV